MKNKRIQNQDHILLFWEEPKKESPIEKKEIIYNLDLPKKRGSGHSYQKIFDRKYKEINTI